MCHIWQICHLIYECTFMSKTLIFKIMIFDNINFLNSSLRKYGCESRAEKIYGYYRVIGHD